MAHESGGRQLIRQGRRSSPGSAFLEPSGSASASSCRAQRRSGPTAADHQSRVRRHGTASRSFWRESARPEVRPRRVSQADVASRSSILATCMYSDAASTPNFRMLSASRPSRSTSLSATSTTRWRLSGALRSGSGCQLDALTYGRTVSELHRHPCGATSAFGTYISQYAKARAMALRTQARRIPIASVRSRKPPRWAGKGAPLARSRLPLGKPRHETGHEILSDRAVGSRAGLRMVTSSPTTSPLFLATRNIVCSSSQQSPSGSR